MSKNIYCVHCITGAGSLLHVAVDFLFDVVVVAGADVVVTVIGAS